MNVDKPMEFKRGAIKANFFYILPVLALECLAPATALEQLLQEQPLDLPAAAQTQPLLALLRPRNPVAMSNKNLVGSKTQTLRQGQETLCEAAR